MTQKFFFRHHKKKIFFFLTKKKKKISRRVTKKKNFFFSTFRQSADSRPTGADTVDLEPCHHAFAADDALQSAVVCRHVEPHHVWG